MSVTIETLVSCDTCGETHSGDDRYLTVREIRENRKTVGWIQIGACDYCKSCAQAARAAERDRKKQLKQFKL